jgi:hypothetical protein
LTGGFNVVVALDDDVDVDDVVGIALERAHQAWIDETIASLSSRPARSRPRE